MNVSAYFDEIPFSQDLTAMGVCMLEWLQFWAAVSQYNTRESYSAPHLHTECLPHVLPCNPWSRDMLCFFWLSNSKWFIYVHVRAWRYWSNLFFVCPLQKRILDGSLGFAAGVSWSFLTDPHTQIQHRCNMMIFGHFFVEGWVWSTDRRSVAHPDATLFRKIWDMKETSAFSCLKRYYSATEYASPKRHYLTLTITFFPSCGGKLFTAHIFQLSSTSELPENVKYAF